MTPREELTAAHEALASAAFAVCYEGGNLDPLKTALARLTTAAENALVRAYMEGRT